MLRPVVILTTMLKYIVMSWDRLNRPNIYWQLNIMHTITCGINDSWETPCCLLWLQKDDSWETGQHRSPAMDQCWILCPDYTIVWLWIVRAFTLLVSFPLSQNSTTIFMYYLYTSKVSLNLLELCLQTGGLLCLLPIKSWCSNVWQPGCRTTSGLVHYGRRLCHFIASGVLLWSIGWVIGGARTVTMK